MRVKVVTAAYNAADFIGATIESVLAQTHTDWIHVVVDDGSTDATSAVAGRYAESEPRVRLLSVQNGGQARARNVGLAAPDGPFDAALFLDADDILRPNALARLIAALAEHPDAPAAHGRSACIDVAGRPIPHEGRERLGRRRRGPSATALPRRRRFRYLHRAEPTSLAELSLANPISTPGQVLVRAAALPQRPFDADLVGAEDWQLWIDLAAATPLSFVDDVVIDYRRHGSNSSADWGRTSTADYRVRVRLAQRTSDLAVRRDVRALAAQSLDESVTEFPRAIRRGNPRQIARTLRWVGFHGLGYLLTYVPGRYARGDEFGRPRLPSY